MNARSTLKPSADTPYNAADEKATEAFWSDAIAHKGVAELRRLRGQRGAQKTPKKAPVSIRYDREVIEAFKASGPGWQTRMNAALADWLKNHSPKELSK